MELLRKQHNPLPIKGLLSALLKLRETLIKVKPVWKITGDAMIAKSHDFEEKLDQQELSAPNVDRRKTQRHQLCSN